MVQKCLSSLLLVQHECIPQAILGMDVLCQAKSGMGKTAVFVLATLQQLEPVTGQVCWGSVLERVWRLNHREGDRFWLRVLSELVFSSSWGMFSNITDKFPDALVTRG